MGGRGGISASANYENHRRKTEIAKNIVDKTEINRAIANGNREKYCRQNGNRGECRRQSQRRRSYKYLLSIFALSYRKIDVL